MNTARAFALCVALALAGPAAAQDPSPDRPLPLAGFEEDLAELPGEWVGGYAGDSTGRRGTFLYRFAVGVDSAYGHVVMVPRTRPGEEPRPMTLWVRLVWVADGFVEGFLEPYADPETGVELETWFEGRLDGDALEGVFEARAVGVQAPHQTGRWWARRAGPL